MTKEQALAYCRKHVVFQMLPWLGKVENDLSFQLLHVNPSVNSIIAKDCFTSTQATKHDFGPSVACPEEGKVFGSSSPSLFGSSSPTLHEANETKSTLYRLQILTSSASRATCSSDDDQYDDK